MKIPVIVLFLLLCSPSFLSAQKIVVSGLSDTLPANTSFFIGENHAIRDLWALKYSLARHLYLHYEIHNIVIEYSKSQQYASNNYLINGDTTLFASPALFGADYFNQFLKPLKRLTDSSKGHTVFTIHGMDFERISFVNTVAYILAKYDKPSISSTSLSKYVKSIPAERLAGIRRYPVYSRKYREAVTDMHTTARAYFTLDSSLLKRELSGFDYEAVRKILDNIPGIPRKKGSANNNRDKNLYTSLSQCHTPFVCFVGGFHTAHSNRNSLVNQYLNNHSTPVAVINMVCADAKKLVHEHTVAAALKEETNKRFVLDSCMSTAAHLKITPSSRLSGIPDGYYKHAPSYFIFFPQALLVKP